MKPASLPAWRPLLDLTDAAMRRLLRLRGQLVDRIAQIKQAQSLPLRDPMREQRMHAIAERDARHLGLASADAHALLELSLASSRRGTALDAQPSGHPSPNLLAGPRSDGLDVSDCEGSGSPEPLTMFDPLLGRLPAPQQLAPWLRRLPPALWRTQLQHTLSTALQPALQQDLFEALNGRRLAIEVTDLALRWALSIQSQQIVWLPDDTPTEAAVRGQATDLLLLASRREDADTLFFQRRLQLTGDVELGLTARNLLDRLPWETIPLGPRILLHRFAGLCERARRAHHSRQAARSNGPERAESEFRH